MCVCRVGGGDLRKSRGNAGVAAAAVTVLVASVALQAMADAPSTVADNAAHDQTRAMLFHTLAMLFMLKHRS